MFEVRFSRLLLIGGTMIDEIVEKIREIMDKATEKNVEIIYTSARLGDVKRNYSKIRLKNVRI